MMDVIMLRWIEIFRLLDSSNYERARISKEVLPIG